MSSGAAIGGRDRPVRGGRRTTRKIEKIGSRQVTGGVTRCAVRRLTRPPQLIQPDRSSCPSPARSTKFPNWIPNLSSRCPTLHRLPGFRRLRCSEGVPCVRRTSQRSSWFQGVELIRCSSIVLTLCYALLLPVALYRLLSPKSRALVLVRVVVFCAVRVATWIIRAVQSGGTSYSTGLFIAELIMLSLGKQGSLPRRPEQRGPSQGDTVRPRVESRLRLTNFRRRLASTIITAVLTLATAFILIVAHRNHDRLEPAASRILLAIALILVRPKPLLRRC